MGIGDEIMVTGRVREAFARNGRPVAVRDRNGRVRWVDIWAGNDKIVNPRFTGAAVPQGAQALDDGPGMRPYIAEKHLERWVWKTYGPPVGEIFLTSKERTFAQEHAGRIIVEPHLKLKASPNKNWGWVNWNKLVWLAGQKNLRLTQIGPGDAELLQGVDYVPTRDFREACAVLSTARACVLPEGGLHHAAAALNTPAVIIFGGYIAPAVTGYASQVNLFTGGGLGCGQRTLCAHCAAAMAAIKPETVLTELERLLVN